jgi:hypothetical protein
MQKILFLMITLSMLSCGFTHKNGSTHDNSTKNAPTSILSTDVVYFKMSFDNSTYSESKYSSGIYSLTLQKTGNGAYCEASNHNDMDIKCNVDSSALDSLQAVIVKTKLALDNGHHAHNSAVGSNYDVEVRYSSGENISVSGEGGASTLPKYWYPEDYLDLFSRIVKKAGKEFK